MNTVLKTAPEPKLLLELEPAYRVFFRNLFDTLLFRHMPRVTVDSTAGAFWDDVFVYSGPPWRAIAESVLWHALMLTALWNVSLGWIPKELSPRMTKFDPSSVVYYPASQSFPASASNAPRARSHTKGTHAAASPAALKVAAERRRGTGSGMVTPPDLKLASSGTPGIGAPNPAIPAVPLSATSRAKLTLPSDVMSTIAPAPDVRQAGSGRGRGIPQPSMTAVGPAPDAGTAPAGRVVSAPGSVVVGPAPTVSVALLKVGDMDIGASEVVAPSPQLPMHEQHMLPGMAQGTLGGSGVPVVPPPPSVLPTAGGVLSSGRGAALSGGGLKAVPPAPSVDAAGGSIVPARGGALSQAGVRVVPPPPSIRGAGNTVAGNRGSALSSGGLQVVPPPPSVQAAIDSGSGGRGYSLSGGGLRVVPPPPTVQGAGNSGFGGRGGSLAGSGLQAVAPAPSLQEGNSGMGGRAEMLGGSGVSVVPPAPSLEGAGNAGGGGRGSSIAGSGMQVVPPAPSGQDGRGSGSERLMAMDTQPDVSPPPPAEPDIPNLPGTQELPVRLVALALALPGSSYFSNYEVFIAERQLGGNESQLIKLVYISLPYQRRLSEYTLSNAKVYKLRVTRDETCDETLLQMTGPQGDANARAAAALPALSTANPNRVLPCYRTTADDYRRALSRSR